MFRRINFFQVVLAGLLVLLLISVSSIVAATNTVNSSHAGVYKQAITANDLKPTECAGLNLVDVVTAGTKNNDLLLGDDQANNLSGKGGSDCIVGGAGNDTLTGGAGPDVLLGGPGDDALNGGGGADICYGGPGNNTFKQCDTIHNP